MAPRLGRVTPCCQPRLTYVADFGLRVSQGSFSSLPAGSSVVIRLDIARWNPASFAASVQLTTRVCRGHAVKILAGPLRPTGFISAFE